MPRSISNKLEGRVITSKKNPEIGGLNKSQRYLHVAFRVRLWIIPLLTFGSDQSPSMTVVIAVMQLAPQGEGRVMGHLGSWCKRRREVEHGP